MKNKIANHLMFTVIALFTLLTVNAQAPTITSFSPLSAKPGDVVTITGTNFQSASVWNTVYFGATRATLTAASSTTLTAIVPTGATYAPITVTSVISTLSASSRLRFNPIYAPAKTSITATDFSPTVNFTTGSIPASAAIGDLDGDGKSDMVVANIGSNTVSVYLNISTSGSIGATSFAAKVDFTTGTQPRSVVIGDLDGDGKPDLAVANYDSNNVSILRNTSTSGTIGATSFAAKQDFTTGTNPVSLAIGDLDGDGKPDLAVANFDSNNLSVLRNTGTSGTIGVGSFAAKQDFATGTNPSTVAMGDLDGDGKPDLAVANFSSNNVSVLRNISTSGTIGAGSFAAKQDFVAGTNPISVAIGDLDGDGEPDLVLTDFSSLNVSVLRNIGTIGSIESTSFAAKVDFTTGSQPRNVVMGDLDGDGKPDLAVVNQNSNNVSVYRNTCASGTIGADSFAAKQDFGTGTTPFALAIGDLDGDGKPDLAVTNYFSNNVSVLRNADIIVPPTITSFSPLSAKPGDVVTITGTNFSSTTTSNIVFFGATRALITAATATSITATVPLGATYASIALLNTDSKFTVYSTQKFNPIFEPAKITIKARDFLPKKDFTAGDNPKSVVLGDLDGDGKPEMIVSNSSSNTLSIYRNISSNGTVDEGSFAPKVDFITGQSPTAIAIGDLDGDGKPDLAVANENSSSISIFRNSSTNGIIDATSFASKIDFLGLSSPTDVAIGDIDGDGKLDLAAVNRSFSSVSIFFNTSISGTINATSFAPKVDFYAGAQPTALAIGDLDGDSKPDLAIANSGGSTQPRLAVLRNTSLIGVINSSSFAAAVVYVTENAPESVTIGDLDGDGKLDVVLGVTVVNRKVSVFRNTSTIGVIDSNSFSARVDFATGIRPSSVSLGDLNGDGKPDLVVANSGSNSISVFRNISTSGSFTVGSFAAKVDFATGASPFKAVIGDVDSDGKPDLIVTNSDSDNVSILKNADIVAPKITSFTPISAKPGDVVTISGTNFNIIAANNIVFFGATKATVTAATATSITVTVPTSATYAPISVLNIDNNLAANSSTKFNPVYAPVKLNLSAADFAPKQDFVTGTSPFASAVGDLNGDGKPDVVAVNNGSNSISIFQNTSANGSISASSFAAKVDFMTHSQPFSVAIGDLDGDGKPDLAVVNRLSNSISVYINTNNGGNLDANSFATKVDYVTGSDPRFVAIGDIDGDGKLDLAITNYLSDNVSILLNNYKTESFDATSFLSKVDFATGIKPLTVAIGDLDGDGKPDLAVTNYDDGNVSVLRNTSTLGIINTNSFASKVDFITGTLPQAVAIGDLDGDGKSELVVNNLNDTNISILKNTATSGSIAASSFASAIYFTTVTQTNTIAIGDLDGDGKPDLALANIGSNNVSIFKNNTVVGTINSTSFSDKIDFATGVGPTSAQIVDIDGDALPDLITTNFVSNSISVFRNSEVKPPVITSFTPASAKPGDSVTITGINFNATPSNNIVFFGATKATVTASSGASITATVPQGATFAPISVLISGSGLMAHSTANFNPIYNPAKSNITATDFDIKQDLVAGNFPNSVAISDLDGDGKPDLAVVNGDSETISIYRNISSSGSLMPSSFATRVDISTGSGSFPSAIAIGDIDGDGKPDLVVINSGSETVSVYKNSAIAGIINSSSFAPKVDFIVGAFSISLAIRDMDADGKPDLLVLNNGADSVSILKNTGSKGIISAGSFAVKVDFTTGFSPISLAVADLNGDDKPDFAVVNNISQTVSVFRNTTTSGTINAGSFDAKVDFTAGVGPTAIDLGDIDGDNKPEMIVANFVGNTVSVLRNTTAAGVFTAGSFATPVDFTTGSGANYVAIGDFDGNGTADLAVANNISDTVSLFRNSGVIGNITTSSFNPKVDFLTGVGPYMVAIGDLDRDGKPDLVIPNSSANSISIIRNADGACSITTWDGTSWSNGTPAAGKKAVISGNYNGSGFSACALEVTGNAIVDIPSGQNLVIEYEVVVTPSATLNLNNNANLIQSRNIVNAGNIIVKRNSSSLVRLDYSFWSSPVANQNLLAFSPETTASRFYTYNTTTNLFSAIDPLSNIFQNGKGYSIRMPNTHPITNTVWQGIFAGVPNNGNINVSLNNIAANQRYNLVGNPYPSPISLVSFVAQNSSNITGTLYFWRKPNSFVGNGWSTYTGGTFVTAGPTTGAIDPQGILQIGQGFVVEASAAGNSISFDNSMRVANNDNQFFRTTNFRTETAPQMSRIWLNTTSNSGQFSQMALSYIDGGTIGLDVLDGKSLGENDLKLTSQIGGTTDLFTIQSRPYPFDATDVVPLHFSTATADTFQIAVHNKDGVFATNQNIFLKDNLAGITHNIKQNPYSFTSTTGTFNNRFQIVYVNSVLGIDNPTFNENSVIVFKKDNTIHINSGTTQMKSVQVYDLRGRLVATQSNIKATTTKLDLNVEQQVSCGGFYVAQLNWI